MNKYLRSINTNSGFSLIEVMVCVAIMGVLATIAVPNMTMMADRAHQNEAKVELAAIYATEKRSSVNLDSIRIVYSRLDIYQRIKLGIILSGSSMEEAVATAKCARLMI